MRPTLGTRWPIRDKGRRGQKVAPAKNAARLDRRSPYLLVVAHNQHLISGRALAISAVPSPSPPLMVGCRSLGDAELYGIIGMDLEMAFICAERTSTICLPSSRLRASRVSRRPLPSCRYLSRR